MPAASSKCGSMLLNRHKKEGPYYPVPLSLYWLPVRYRVECKMLSVAFKAVNGLVPPYLRKLLHVHAPAWPLKSSSQLLLHVAKTKLKIRSNGGFVVAAPSLWYKNSLPLQIRSSPFPEHLKSSRTSLLFGLGCFECAIKIKLTFTFLQIGKRHKNCKYSCFRWSHASDCVIHGDKQSSPVRWFVFVPRVLRKKTKKVGWLGWERPVREEGWVGRWSLRLEEENCSLSSCRPQALCGEVHSGSSELQLFSSQLQPNTFKWESHGCCLMTDLLEEAHTVENTQKCM